MGLLDALIYPPVGFHFAVVVEMSPQTPQDFRFQSVSGLGSTITPEPVMEGGENRFKHQFPTIPFHSNVVLKRGKFIGSFVVAWCINAIENFDFQPHDVLITLLNDMHIPVCVWQLINAFPVKWSITEFNAEQNSVAIESIELAYQYYRTISLDSLLTGSLSLSASASVSI